METAEKYIFCSTNNLTTSRTGYESLTFLVHTFLYGPNAKLALVFPGAVTRICLLLPRPTLKTLDTSSWFCSSLGISSPKSFLVTTRFSLNDEEEQNREGKKWLFKNWVPNTSQGINCIFTCLFVVASYKWKWKFKLWNKECDAAFYIMQYLSRKTKRLTVGNLLIVMVRSSTFPLRLCIAMPSCSARFLSSSTS